MAAVFAARAARQILRLMGRAGTSLPGKVAMLIDPEILSKLSSRFHVIAVTGTNGKTTTTAMISKILDANGVRHITNKSGANMVTGIATAFVEEGNFRGEGSCDWAVLEIDEATVDQLSEEIHPEILVVTNFFRDQLDRYGEVHSVIRAVLNGIGRSPRVRLVLNADDSLCAFLGARSGRECVYFGIEPGAVPPQKEADVSTASFCLFCREKYEYSYRVLGHLGGFCCTGCGFRRPCPEVKCTGVAAVRPDHSVFQLDMDGETSKVRVNLPGLFNVYNALAAAACGRLLGFPSQRTAEVLECMESCFGRMEAIPTEGNKRILLMLVKNPVGFNQVLRTILLTDRPLSAAFLINDKDQDGTDISWLWDVDFERMCAEEDGIAQIYASGLRAEDMALRLKYAGLSQEKIRIQKNFRALIRDGLSELPENGVFYIAATYTALLELRAYLRKQYGLRGICG